MNNNFTRLIALVACSTTFTLCAQQQGSTPKPNIPADSGSTAAAPLESSSAAPVEAAPVAQPTTTEVRRTVRKVHPFHEYGSGIQMSSLGAGFQVATPLSQHLDLRAGAHFFTYNGVFDSDSWTYGTNLNLRSGQIQLDYMPSAAHGFHISPGIAIYRNGGGADISIASGRTFEMGDGKYTSSATDPVKGQATFTYKREVAPMITFGFNNLVPRSNRHWSIPVEIGGIFTGAPEFGLGLDGTVCDPQGCGKISSDAGAMNDLKLQRQQVQDKLNDFAQFYPIISVGFAWNFGSR